MNKTKPKKLTFKNSPRETGLAAIGAGTPSIDIRYAGVKVGYINFNDCWNAKGDMGIRIHLMIPKETTPDSSCPWKWGSFTKQFGSGEEARIFLNENFEKISKMIFIQE
jgi:hypothetical protein